MDAITVSYATNITINIGASVYRFEFIDFQTISSATGVLSGFRSIVLFVCSRRSNFLPIADCMRIQDKITSVDTDTALLV